ncbi:UNVERIFIED_CONTAM: hypothetical protein Sindi_2912800, partial [Sesamum indicum]
INHGLLTLAHVSYAMKDDSDTMHIYSSNADLVEDASRKFEKRYGSCGPIESGKMTLHGLPGDGG